MQHEFEDELVIRVCNRVTEPGLKVTRPFRRANGERHGENGRSPCCATKLLMNGRACQIFFSFVCLRNSKFFIHFLLLMSETNWSSFYFLSATSEGF